jgi:hypothetical protein
METPISNILIAGNIENVDTNALSEMTGFTVQTADLVSQQNIDDAQVTDKVGTTALAIAYGAAASELIKTDTSDFRREFMPFQGKKKLLQKSLRTLAVYLTILMAAIGVYFQAELYKKTTVITQLNEQAKESYSEVMFGQKPKTAPSIASQLKKEANDVKKAGGGLSVGDEKSVSAQLTYLLQAINKLPKSVKLTVKNITITSRGVTIMGHTNSRSSTLKLSKEINDHKKLEKGKENFKYTPGTGDSFTIAAKLK